ncbi:hypothetical protein CHLRE_08g384600v5 [Chlamydomonas reinhardtii]|uniref:AB hydrolase-1 domain-containing protein n=1 Tax=Chlamydomonas reinhardtii TaxID=3055 RepID=A0A2K3DIB1_CHLRE|nr:uncharacterized protein CHLRE_08g384600v5 [Chlamydomonas reinhardtii]PNW80265.1 hypothetical protein CHLRE_08g384600v5 [Chlamydomonas reinhardtii]
MPSAGLASPSASAARSAAGAGLRSVSYDELDVQTPLAYELLQGPLARWSHTDATHVPPTAVLVHGILGNRKNMSSFAKMLVEGFPSWQVLLVDLRCHGESAALPGRPEAPHSVASAATDILALLRQLKLFPRVLIGHSFGGKVVMSMVAQFPARLPRPVQVWVLDSLPGQVRAGGGPDGADHPGELIALLRGLAMPVASRNAVMDAVLEAGFSPAIARWVVTNLRPVPGGSPSAGPFSWTFDLDGIADLYSSYETTALWPLLQQPPAGLSLDFVKAERSTFRWGGADEAAIRGAGHGVHLLPNSGHWVHTDNPLGLYDILAPSFGASPDLKQRRTPPGAPRGSTHYY